MHDISKESIIQTLKDNNYARAKTARRLGISPPTLLKLVKHNEIDMQPSPHFHAPDKQYYQDALDECLGVTAAAARYLNVSISTLRKHLKRHKLGPYEVRNDNSNV
jgi:transcriptional regulator with GAF, ATPase, and Fis domain